MSERWEGSEAQMYYEDAKLRGPSRARERQRLVDAVVEAARVWRSATWRDRNGTEAEEGLLADAVDALNAFDATHDEAGQPLDSEAAMNKRLPRGGQRQQAFPATDRMRAKEGKSP